MLFIFCCGILLFNACKLEKEDMVIPDPVPEGVVKTNDTKVYMHFMPWFQSKAVTGYWGSHWRMTNKNPDIIDADGKRQIAAHYYPLTGPYDTKDEKIIEYQLLLMKYSGIDGLLIDWYGTHNVYDYRVNLVGSNAVIDKLEEVGLQFSIVYEDYTAGNVASQTSKTAIQAAKEDMAYMQQNYFSKSNYIKIANAPLLMTFGPRLFKTGAQWNQIFESFTAKPTFIPLWNHMSFVGANGSGEFSWVDFKTDLSELHKFYNKGHPTLIGSAYPGFHDYYVQGGSGTSYGYVDYDNGNTLVRTLAKAQERHAKYVQLVTWNDYGEGTMVEPTLERGFTDLETIQQWCGVKYDKTELELIYEYYQKRVAFSSDSEKSATLKEVYQHLIQLEVDKARAKLDSIQ